jgi:hypothetical protein
MKWFRVAAEAKYPSRLEKFLRAARPKAVRTLLYDGWSNPKGLTEAHQRIRSDTEERRHAVAGLEWRTAVDMVWVKIGLSPLSLQHLPQPLEQSLRFLALPSGAVA